MPIINHLNTYLADMPWTLVDNKAFGEDARPKNISTKNSPKPFNRNPNHKHVVKHTAALHAFAPPSRLRIAHPGLFRVAAVLRQDDELELLLPAEDDFSPIREVSDEEFRVLAGSSEFTVVVGYLPCE